MAGGSKPNEFQLIERFFAPLAADEGLGLKDDAACYAPQQGQDLILSKDILVAGTHFFPNDTPSDVAFKAISVNISDIAAKGANPQGYLLGLAIPGGTTTDWFQSFSAGLREAQDCYSLALLGGDTTSTNGPLVVSVTVIGTLPSGTMIQRKGADVGDDIYVTGTIGDAALGLLYIEQGELPASPFSERLRRPVARHSFAAAIREFSTASADVSDGLLADLGHICDCSGLGAIIRQRDIPLSQAASDVVTNNAACWEIVFTGGDDYELVFTAPQSYRAQLRKAAELAGIKLTMIGEMTQQPSIEVIDLNGKLVQVEAKGYTHF